MVLRRGSRIGEIMKRTRVLLLGLMVALLVLVSRSQAGAIPCPSCCTSGCEIAYQTCLTGCDGNVSCENTCAARYQTCTRMCF
jgi:hypothetical protein